MVIFGGSNKSGRDHKQKTALLVFGVQSLKELCTSVINSSWQKKWRRASVKHDRLRAKLPNYVPTNTKRAIITRLTEPSFPKIVLSRKFCPMLTDPDNTPWVQLATRLAKLACTSTSRHIIDLTLYGEKLKLLKNLLTTAVMDGVSSFTAKVFTTSIMDSDCSIKISSGDVCVSGTVMKTVPVLLSVNGVKCEAVTLRGSMIITKGQTIGDVFQALQGVTQVGVWGDYVVAKVTALPTHPVEGCVAAATLSGN